MADHNQSTHAESHPATGDQGAGHSPAPAESALENYTGSELPYRALYRAALALLLLTIAFVVGLVPLREALIRAADRKTEGAIVPDDERPAGALLQSSPEGDWRVWEALMADRLGSYGWQDRAAGIARIPVDRALELALEEGLIQSAADAVPAKLPASAAKIRGAEEQAGQGHDAAAATDRSGNSEVTH